MKVHIPPPAYGHRWADGAVVYQIYPRSLQDSNGDGIGDLPGIMQRLDYLQSLGVTALWLSPFYPSPMADFGYDISDHCAVDPVFGTLDDFSRLVAEVHRRGMRLMVDLVPNHTSDQHAWFRQSAASRVNPYANWYTWRDPHPDSSPHRPQPPNNWLNALTGHSAWQWEPRRKQFYLHSFAPEQPDLNWSNRDVREAMKRVMRFWLDRGVDGFRVDAVPWMAKDPLLHDDAPNPAYVSGEDGRYNSLLHTNSLGWPTLYTYLSEMAAVLKEPAYATVPRFMVTEAYPSRHNPVASYMMFYEGIDPEVAAPFNFEGLLLDWKAGPWRRFLRSFHYTLHDVSAVGVASYAFGNHDKPRLASRLGDAAARSAALLLFTLPGMVFVYYGEELGMQDVPIPLERIHDPAAQDDPHGQGRDPARTPMQWSAEPHAGFSATEPWLPVHRNYWKRNVVSESADPYSFLSLYRALMKLRAQEPALSGGTMQVLEPGHPDVLAYGRRSGPHRFVVLLNFSDRPVTVLPGVKLRQLLLSSEPHTQLTDRIDGEIKLLPHEGALFLQ
jgi:alpha-glucosidase